MAQFNFTIRATDNEGAYADRAFNITVKNSRIERYAVIDANDAYTSADGATWTRRPGAGGQQITYGNGMWMTIDQQFGPGAAATISNLRKSTDGINWISTSSRTGVQHQAQDGTALPATYIMSSGKLRFYNGMFYVVGWSPRPSANQALMVARSVDGVTWIWNVIAVHNTTSAPGQNYDMKLTYDNGVLFVNNTTASPFLPIQYSCLGWRSSDGITWSPVIYSTTGTLTSYCSWLGRINGMYFAASVTNAGHPQQSGRAYMWSSDGVNWTNGDFANNSAINGSLDTTIASFSQDYRNIARMFYANGTIYAFPNRTSTSANGSAAYVGHYWTSSDGINWVDRQYKAFNNNPAMNVYAEQKNGAFLIAPSNGQYTNLTSTPGSNTSPHGGIRFNQVGLYGNYNLGLTPGNDSITQSFTDVAILG